MRALIVIGLALFGLFGQSEAKCKAHHTSWKTAAQPVVSQPVSTNPEKVLVTWAGMMNNQRCVDWYTVSIMKDGKAVRQYVNVTGQAVTRLEVIVEPCNKYYFQVEFSQQSFWRSKVHQHKSGITMFKTHGIPKIKPSFDWRYDLDIYYKLENGVHNLFRPVVSFLKDDLLINGDCIRDIQLDIVQPSGGECSRMWNTTSCMGTEAKVYKAYKTNFEEKYIHDERTNCDQVSCPMVNTITNHDHVTRHFDEDENFDEFQGVYRGNVDAAFNFLERNKTARCPVVKCPRCRNRREASTGQSGQVFYPEQQNGQSGQTFYPEQPTNGATGGTWYPDRRDQNQDRRGYGGTFVDTSSSHQRGNYNDRQRRSVKVSKRGRDKNVIVTPPFNKRIELEMEASQHGSPCKWPLFVEMVVNNAGNGTEHLRLRDIKIPLIHQSTRFVPPTMSMVVKEIMSGKGKMIPDECIPLYMLAIDENVRQTHGEVKFYENQYEKLEDITHKKLEHSHPVASTTPASTSTVTTRTRTAPVPPTAAKVIPAGTALSDRQHHKKKEMLKRLGCLCHQSEFVKVTVKDENANYYYPNTTGAYEFTGKVYGGKPYYTHTTTSGSDHVTYYLYYYPSQDTWYIDDNLGDSKPKLAIVGNYNRCPGDMSIIRVTPPKWQYVKSLVWYNVNHMFVSCGVL